jgi:hypothetical protein
VKGETTTLARAKCNRDWEKGGGSRDKYQAILELDRPISPTNTLDVKS